MEKKKNTPKLRFPEFTGEWEEKKLGEVAIFKSGYAFKSEFMLSKKCKYQILKMSNVYQNELNLERNPSYLESIDEKQKDFLLRKGDSILTLTGTVGKKDFGYSVIINEDNKFLLNQRLVLLREIASISANGFINYILSTEKFLFFFFAEAKGGTGNQTNVSTEDVKNISLGFPHLSEQTKIATFLAAVDEKLTQLKKKKTLLEQYKKGVMQKLFSQELRFKDDNNQDFPDWQEKTLGEISIKKASNMSANAIEDNLGDYIIYGAAGVLKKVDFYEEENDYIGIVKDGAGVGRLLLCERKSSVLGTLDIIKPNSEVITYFLYCLLSCIDFTKYVTGSTIPHIYYKDYSKDICNFPSLSEQQKIATFLSAIDEKINHCSVQIEKMETWKKGLLQQMFC